MLFVSSDMLTYEFTSRILTKDYCVANVLSSAEKLVKNRAWNKKKRLLPEEIAL